jgi:hypothetical protein
MKQGISQRFFTLKDIPLLTKLSLISQPPPKVSHKLSLICFIIFKLQALALPLTFMAEFLEDSASSSVKLMKSLSNGILGAKPSTFPSWVPSCS